jgi:DNA-binding transcriptional MocR family regulator
VSHLLQRLTLAQVTDPDVAARIERAAQHYERRNAEFSARLAARGLAAPAGDGLNLWVPLPVPARAVVESLMRRGWLARSGDDFALAGVDPSRRLRLTVHELDDGDADQLADDIAAAVDAVAGRLPVREVG